MSNHLWLWFPAALVVLAGFAFGHVAPSASTLLDWHALAGVALLAAALIFVIAHYL